MTSHCRAMQSPCRCTGDSCWPLEQPQIIMISFSFNGSESKLYSQLGISSAIQIWTGSEKYPGPQDVQNCPPGLWQLFLSASVLLVHIPKACFSYHRIWLTLTGVITLHPKAENPPEFSTKPLPTPSPAQHETRQPSCMIRGSALGQVFRATLSWGLDCACGVSLVSFAQVGNRVVHRCGHHKLFCTGWGCCSRFVGELRWCPSRLGTWKTARRNINQLWSPVNLRHSNSGRWGTWRHVGGDAADRRQRLKANYGEFLIPLSSKNSGERAL